MPRRWSTETRAWAYRYLCLRDGEVCRECGKIPTTFYGLDIDHVDCNKHNNAESNLRLLCRRCNVSRENRKRANSPSVGEGERENPRTRIIKCAVPYSEGSPEMQANGLFEVVYRNWLQKHISDNVFISKKEAINAGAEVCGCNPTTAAKYLSKLTSLCGPLTERKDMLGEMMVLKKEPPAVDMVATEERRSP